jgi:capsular polysaccharide biosynthesis protein
MNTKPLVVAARYKLLLIVPFLVLVPIAGVLSFMSNERTYTSTARLLARQSAVLDDIGTSNDNRFASAAQNRANELNEYLATDSFRKDVAKRIGLPTDTPEAADASAWEVGKGMVVYAGGTRLLIVEHRSSDPEMAQRIVTGVVEQFREKYRNNVELNVDIALQVYGDELDARGARVEEAEDALAAYVGSRPNADLQADATLAGLQRDVDTARRDYTSTENTLLGIRLQKESTLRGQDVTLILEDQANFPTVAQQKSKRELLAMPIAGMLLALSISAAIYAFLLRTDNSIRTSDDLEAFPGLTVLGTVPDVGGMKRRHWPKHFFRVAVAGLGVTTQR